MSRENGLSLRSPALLLVAIASFASLLISVTYRIHDRDLWQHLAVGRWVWMKHALPMVHEWTWPLWGTPEVNSSWGFEVMLFPFWDRGGLMGLFVWRWLTTALAFGFVWAAARRMGARGLTPAFVIALCGLTYRLRSDLRPETLSSILFAAMLWILETRRNAAGQAGAGPARGSGGDPAIWLVPLAWLWANTHISYCLGLATIALYFADAWLQARRGGAAAGGAPRLATLVWVGLAAGAISFVNPFGWRALWQPFEYLLYWRHELVYQNIGELRALDWKHNWRSGLPLLMVAWPLLAIWRWRKRGLDLVELGLVTVFTVQALGAQRFLGTYALVAAPFVSRDLSDWLATLGARRAAKPAGRGGRGARAAMPAPAAGRLPRLPLMLRAALVAVACLAIGPLEWSRWDLPFGLSMDHASYVIRASDFMERHGVGGKGLNNFGMSGYQIWRFWPDRGRLPFIDQHASGVKEDRDLYALAQFDSASWRRLDDKHHFDYVLLPRVQFGGDRLLNTLDADSAFTLVFKDDASALYVRRAGALAGVADSFAYRVVPASNRALGQLGAAAGADSALRARVRAELDREIHESPWHGQAMSLLANLALIEGDWPAARAMLDSVLAIDETRPRLHQRLGLLDLVDGRPREALKHFAREVEIHGPSAPMDLAAGSAWARQGRYDRAAAAARRALRREPGSAEAADSLRAWERRTPQ